MVDEESKKIKYVRIARRIPEEERWHADDLEWVQGADGPRGTQEERTQTQKANDRNLMSDRDPGQG